MNNIYSSLTIKSESNVTLEKTIASHRVRFDRIVKSRIYEILPQLINYTNKNQPKIAIDFLKLELNLRNNTNIIIGEMSNGLIGILGYTQRDAVYKDNLIINNDYILTEDDIIFTIPINLRLPKYEQITEYDGYSSGNFVVMKNKYLCLMCDSEIINHYVDELTEIVVTRFSLIIQGKFSKIFQSEIDDETINQLIAKLHNGTPFVKMGEEFSVTDQLHDLTSVTQVQMLTELKREYQNKINEMLTFLGVDNIAIDKESGVSSNEVNSNNPFTTINTDVYLKGRTPIENICKRYNLKKITPYFAPNVKVLIEEKYKGGNDNE